MATSTQYKYLEREPKSLYRQLSIKGRGIKARTLYGQYASAEEPRTVDEIARDWDLPVEAVREAIAYVEANPPEIDEDFRREEALAEAGGVNEAGYKYNPKPKDLTPQQWSRIFDDGTMP